MVGHQGFLSAATRLLSPLARLKRGLARKGDQRKKKKKKKTGECGNWGKE